MTIGAMPGPVTDARAGALLARHLAAFGGPERLPVPVESIAADLLGLLVEESEEARLLGCARPGRAADLGER